MNVLPWYVYVGFSVPFLLLGVVVGAVVAGVRGVPRPLIIMAGAAGAVSGQWWFLALPRLVSSAWLISFIGALLGSCVLSVIAAWLTKR